MPELNSCIAGTYEPGNIPASSGQAPVQPTVPSFEDPDSYDPDAITTYSLDYSKFYNSGYALLLMV